MIFLEHQARFLLVAHALLAAFLVGASTHQLLWCRGYRRAQFHRATSERRMVAWVALAYLATFALGALLYPAYKVRVRGEYFDSPSAVAAEAALRRAEDARLDEGAAPPAGVAAGRAPAAWAPEAIPDLTWVGRFFDIKEHWVALGAGAALVLWLLAAAAHPSVDARFLRAYLGLSFVVCASAWAGAVIGLVTAAYRTVGGLS